MREVIYFTLTVLLGLLGACDDFLEEKSEIEVTNNNFWQNERDLESFNYGIMNSMRYCLVGCNMCYEHDRGLLLDYQKKSYNLIDCNEIEPNNLSASWAWIYVTIAEANTLMENIYRADLSKERHDFYYGQALYTRSYCYFYILRNWGDAPLILNSLNVGEKARTSWLEIADQVESDLREVTRLLPGAADLRDRDGKVIVNKQFASSGTAHALLTHLYAWRGALNKEPDLFIKGIQEADSVVLSGEYSLAADPKEVCDVVMLGNSTEGIYELDFEGNGDSFNTIDYGAHWGMLVESWPVIPNTTPATKRNIARISNKRVMELYPDLSDKRRDEYFYKLDSMARVSESITQGGAYVNKWRAPYLYVDGPWAGDVMGFENNLMLMRLAGIILLRAELKEKTGDSAGAIADLNAIRDRAGAPRYQKAEGDLKEAIARERDKELFLEPFIRYNDIVRNGTFREKMQGKFKTLTEQDVADGALYWPVYSDAFKDNTLMRQTIYWKRNGHDF